MQDAVHWAAGAYVATRPVAGSTVMEVTEGTHVIYLLTRIRLAIDAEAENTIEGASLTAAYFPYDSSALGTTLRLQQ